MASRAACNRSGVGRQPRGQNLSASIELRGFQVLSSHMPLQLQAQPIGTACVHLSALWRWHYRARAPPLHTGISPLWAGVGRDHFEEKLSRERTISTHQIADLQRLCQNCVGRMRHTSRSDLKQPAVNGRRRVNASRPAQSRLLRASHPTWLSLQTCRAGNRRLRIGRAYSSESGGEVAMG